MVECSTHRLKCAPSARATKQKQKHTNKRVFSLDASFGLLATARASALALFLGSGLSFCGVSCMI